MPPLLDLLALALLPSAAPPAPLAAPPPALAQALQNGGFEQAGAGGLPQAWTLGPGHAGMKATLRTSRPAEGAHCLAFAFDPTAASQPHLRMGHVAQSLDATPWRGQRIRLSAQVEQSTSPLGRGTIRLQVLDASGRPLRTVDPLRLPAPDAWGPVEIVCDIPTQAAQLKVSLLSERGAITAFDAVRLERLGPAPAPIREPARPLTEQGRINAVAFARLLGWVRFFHPSDEAADADWGRIAITGLRAVEGARDAQALAQCLREIFLPLAPSLQILRAGEAPAPYPQPAGATALRRWEHQGVGLSPDSIYRSTRTQGALHPRPNGWASPEMPERLDLGAGLCAAMPLVVWHGPAGTLPAAPRPALASLPEPTPFPGDLEDRATRLADVVLTWTTFQHFYPYFDRIDTDWAAELPRALQAAATDATRADFLRTLNRLVARLKDGHASAFDARSPQILPLPLALRHAEGAWRVEAAGEAASAVPLGSELLAVDQEPLAVREQALRETISAAGEGWMQRRLAGALVTFPVGSQHTLDFRTPSGAPVTVKLQPVASPEALVVPRRPARIAEVKPGFWYVDLDRIDSGAFTQALPDLARAKGVIFDLRGYPRCGTEFLQHLTDRPLQSAYWKVPRVTRPDRQGWTFEGSGRWNLPPLKPRITGKVAFLTGGGAISYAESCMGIVEAYHLGAIVGEPTAGTNGNVNTFLLPGGISVRWTGMQVLKHDGSPHHGVGIRPTVPVSPTVKGLAENRDEILDKALEVVGG